ncbi:MAG: alpha/beta fold hydrolase [Acidimicrobiia bacterium]|nr:alpha/beta fold hydrolase [Acidimicrobiia bacterium]
MFEVVGLSVSKLASVSRPPGRTVEVPGRGDTFVYEMEGPPGAPVLFLIHGLVATTQLNWFPAFPVLADHYRVIATDLRGHGRGFPAGNRFRLSDCADDIAAVADALGVERFIPVGYSLGGPVAQLVWHRHRDRVDGLVLAATSRNFGGTLRERTWYRIVPGIVAGTRVIGRIRGGGRPPDEVELGDDAFLSRWAIEELRRSSPTVALQAMSTLGRFSSHEWIEQVDVPTAVVVTTRDRFISPTRQIKLANAIPGATIHPVHAGHAACVLAYRRFVPGLVDACNSVAGRVGGHVEHNSERLGPGLEEA